MDAQEFRNLQEAYMEVVMTEGVVDSPYDRAQTDRAGAYDRAQTDRAGSYDRAQKKKKQKTQKEQVDIYDIILSHLLDEGYAETVEAAEVIMVNMSEDWRESIMIDEGAAQRVAARAQKLANQRKGQTPKRKATYQSLAYKADERANPKPEADWRTGISDSDRKMRVSTYADRDKVKIKTTNPKKLRKQKAMGELKDSYDIYDIILSHLLDEEYAETVEAAEVIMVNMSEDWRNSIIG